MCTDSWLCMGQSETLGIWLETLPSGRQLLVVQGLCVCERERQRLYRWLWRSDGKSLVLMFRAVLLGCVLVMNKAEDGALSFGPYHSSAGMIFSLIVLKSP